MTTPPLKVVLINNSDTIGGAAVVTYRLMQALRREGVDARMIVFHKTSQDDNVIQSKHYLSFLRECAYIFTHNGFDRPNLFKISAGKFGLSLWKHPWVRQADVIALNWINQGLLSLDGIKELASLGKPIVWTMHDMWQLTGVCHHAYECTRYRERCGNCPYINDGAKEADLSRRQWMRKQNLYDDADIRFVAVSNWLAEKCAESSLLRNRNIEVIPNAFPINLFHTAPTRPLPWRDIDQTKTIILMGAARIDDPIKGLDYAIDALNIVATRRKDIAEHSQMVFFGNIREPSRLDRLKFPYIHVGVIQDAELLRQLYSSANVVLSTSLYETLPGTLIEGQAAGCTPVTFGMGGQNDIVDHLKSGYIAEYRSAESIADGIIRAVENPIDRNALHEQVRSRFASAVIARRYIELFNRILSDKRS